MESVKSAIHSIASTLTGSSTLTQSEPLGDSNIQCEDDNLSHETKNKLNLSEQSSTTDKEVSDTLYQSRQLAPQPAGQSLNVGRHSASTISFPKMSSRRPRVCAGCHS